MTLWGKFENLNKKINLKLGLFMIQNGRHIFCFWLTTPDVNMPPPPKKKQTKKTKNIAGIYIQRIPLV